ncbi:MAG: recombinase family protein [Wolbachia endosymbiont of Xenopsylla cheopis]
MALRFLACVKSHLQEKMLKEVIKEIKCAIYTRKSCEEGLEQAFNSLDAQRLAGESYVTSQQHEGWILVDKKYDDGGYSGGTLERPALQELFKDIENAKIDCIVVYKIDRLSRSLLDFAKIVDLFDKHKVTFVSVTQSFNTANSMGRLMLNIVLSFAQYERELTGERIRDKFAASKQKGIWMGGKAPIGYNVEDRKLIINQEETEVVRYIFNRFIGLKSAAAVARELNNQGYKTKAERPFKIATVRGILANTTYIGYITHKGKLYPGQHQAIINKELWDKVQEFFIKREGIKPKEEYKALLKGLISCDSCKSVMKATYTKKKSKRYCYYVCNSHIRGKGCLLSSNSIAAGEIERAVVIQIRLLLKNPKTETHLQILDDKKISQLQRIERSWDNLFPREQEKIVQKLVKAIRVSEDGARICINHTELIRLAGNTEEGADSNIEDEEISLFMPLKFKQDSNQAVILPPEFKEEKKINYTLLKVY